ncbi:hypothetical protein DSECCO2_565120 [anaerobic digester metagenome]
MDAVLADAAAGHDDAVAREGPLLVARPAGHGGRHGADGAAEDQGFAQEALVEDDGAVDRRDARLVAAVLHALAYALEDAARVQQARRQLAFMEGGGEAEHVGVAQEVGAHARAHGVAVHADDAGQCSAVWVQGRGAVVGLDLDADVHVVAEADDAGVVLEHGQAEIVLAHALAKLLRAALDEGLVEAVDLGRGAVLAVLVGDAGAEDLVLAVLGPGLGQAFELGVRGRGGQALGLAVGDDLGAGVVVPDAAHLFEAQRQGVLAAQAHEGLVVHGREIDGLDGVRGLAGHGRGAGRETWAGGPGLPVGDLGALDELVGQQVFGDVLHLAAVQLARDQVLGGGVDGDLGVLAQAEHGAQGLAGRAAFVVGYAGAKADLDYPVEIRGGRGGLGRVQDRVVQGTGLDGLVRLGRGQPFDGIDPDDPDLIHVKSQFAMYLVGRLVALGIYDCLAQSHFDSDRHAVLLGGA